MEEKEHTLKSWLLIMSFIMQKVIKILLLYLSTTTREELTENDKPGRAHGGI